MSKRGAQQEFRITPEEDRFLRGFVRRHAGRYVLIAGALVAAALWAGQGGGSGAGAVPEQWRADLDELRAAHESLRAELAAARAESRRLGAELEGVVARVSSADAAARRGGDLEERVATALRRLDRVESRVGEGAGGAAPGSWELGSVLERIEAVETRQERDVRERETFEKSVLNRLYAVEVRAAGQGSAVQIPASPAP